MATTYMHRTPSSGGSGTTFTISFWMKRGKISFGNQTPFISHKGGSDYTWLRFNSSDQMEFLGYKGGPETFDLKTTRKFRDTSAWMHICITFDSTESTSTDRIKFYVNGVKETAFATSNYPTEDNTMIINDTTAANAVGVGNSGETYLSANNYWDGCLSHFHFVDGTAYQASTFGETDSTSGIWKIKTSPTVTYGTNGFFLKMEDRTNLDLDSGTNTFTFTTSGTPTATYDNPSNNFCTWNNLDNYYGANTFTNGNTVITQNASYKTYNVGTLGMAVKGKYYWESMVTTDSNSNYVAGIQGKQSTSTTDYPADHADSSMIDGAGGIFANGSDTGDYGSGYTTSSILSVAYDALNNFVYYGKDGTWLNSGDPTSGASGTGGFDPGAAAIDTDLGAYLPCWGSNFTFVGGVKTNFGNGYFGTTAITSAGTNASGNGTFEYDVPTGYTALCTKGINSF